MADTDTQVSLTWVLIEVAEAPRMADMTDMLLSYSR